MPYTPRAGIDQASVARLDSAAAFFTAAPTFESISTRVTAVDTSGLALLQVEVTPDLACQLGSIHRPPAHHYLCPSLPEGELERPVCREVSVLSSMDELRLSKVGSTSGATVVWWP